MESSRSGTPASLDARLLRFRNRPSPEVAQELAAALLEGGRLAEALEVVDAGLELAPDAPSLWVLEGRVWLAERDLVRAQQALLKAARGAPNDKEPLRWLGEVLLKRGDPERATRVLDKAADIDPHDAAVKKLRERAGRLADVAEGAGASDTPAPIPSVRSPSPRASTAPAAGRSPSRRAPSPPARPLAPTPKFVPAPRTPVPPPARASAPAPAPAPVPATVRKFPPQVDFEMDVPTVAGDARPTQPRSGDVEEERPTRPNPDRVASSMFDEDAETLVKPEPPPDLVKPAPDQGGSSTLDALWADVPVASEAAPVSTRAPRSPVPSGPPDADRIAERLAHQGVLSAEPGETLEWASRKEARGPTTRVGWTMVALWVLVLGAAGGAYYGYQRWTQKEHRRAQARVDDARKLALDGDHKDLVAAERELRLARDMYPKDPQLPGTLLFVQVERTLEEGAFEPGYLRPAMARAKRLGVAGPWIEAAHAVLAAAQGDKDAAARVEALRAKHADNPLLLYVAGRLLHRIGRTEDAVAALQAAVKAEPRLNAARIALAEAQLDAGHAEEAKKALDAVLSRNPHQLRARLFEAFLDAREGDSKGVTAQLGAISDERMKEGAPTDKVLFYLARARVARSAGDEKAAKQAVDKAAKAGATAPRLLAMVASEAKDIGELTLAQQAATLAVQGAPANADRRKLLAAILVAQRDGVGALRTLGPLSDQDPDVLRLSAEAALETGNKDTLGKASEKLSEFIGKGGSVPASLRALRLRIELALGTDGSKLLPQAKRLMSRAADEPGVALAEGDVAIGARDPQVAIAALKHATELDPKSAEAFYLLGRAERMGAHSDEAKASLQKALELDPNHTDARITLGYLLLDRGEYDEADALYQELIKRGQGTAVLLGRVGRVEALVGEGKTDEAQKILDAVPESQRDMVSYHVAAARLALAEGKAKDAIKQLRPLAEDEHASADIIALYGDALYAADEVDPAAGQYARALQLDPGHPESLVGQAQVQVRATKYKDALKTLDAAEQALESRIRPPSLRARLLTLRGEALVERDKMDAAADALRAATALQGVPPDAYFFLGESLSRSSAADARAAYQRYLDVAPTGEYAARAKRALH